MIPVSNAWKASVRNQFRFQAYLCVNLMVVPPDIATGLVAESEDTSDYSDPATLLNKQEQISNKYATLEHNRWPLDGTMKLLTLNTTTEEWWADKTEAVVTIHFDTPQTLIGATITWDTALNTWPEYFNLIGLLNGSVVQTYTLSGSSVKEFYDAPFEDIDQITIQVLSWNKPNWYTRITEIVLGLSIDFDSKNNGRIQSATLIDAANPLNEQQPTHSVDLVLNNLDKYFDPQCQQGLSKYIAQKQFLTLWWEYYTSYNTVERSPNQKYIIDTFNVPYDSADVEFVTTNRLALLTDDFKLGTYTGALRSFWDIAQYILQNSNILYESESVDPWELSTQLQQFTTKAPIPMQSTNVLLQLIALASCCYLKIRSTDGAIVFFNNVSNDFVHSIEVKDTLGNPSGEVIDRLRSINISVYSYNAADSNSEVGKGTYSLSETTDIIINYNTAYATDVSASISGGTIISATYYASYAALTVSAGTNITITLTGKKIDVTKSFIETYRDPLVTDGIDISIDNEFITEVEQLPQISEYVRRYYSRRTRYTIPYLGYPELEAGDKIQLSTIYGNSQPDVINNTIEFNGGWSGTVETI